MPEGEPLSRTSTQPERIETFCEVMRARGISRRSFMKYCSLTATALGLGPAFVPKIAHAMETRPRTPVIWLHGPECTCRSESFIRSGHPLAKDVILSMIGLDHDELLLAPSGLAAQAVLEETIERCKGNDILAVEGNPPLKEDGMFCISGGKPCVDTLKRLARDAGAIIEVPGCPPIAEVMTGVITYRVTFDRMPALDRRGRPLMFYSQRIHDKCYRRPHFDAGQFVENRDDEGARKGCCLHKVGCKGPTTYNACSTLRWNEGVSFPIPSGHGCIGCSEGGFRGQGSFYDRVTDITKFGVEANADRIGRAAVGVTGGAVAAHAALSALKRAQQKAVGSANAARSAREEAQAMLQTPNGDTMNNSGRRIVIDPVTRIEGHIR